MIQSCKYSEFLLTSQMHEIAAHLPLICACGGGNQKNSVTKHLSLLIWISNKSDCIIKIWNFTWKHSMLKPAYINITKLFIVTFFLRFLIEKLMQYFFFSSVSQYVFLPQYVKNLWRSAHALVYYLYHLFMSNRCII